MAKSKSKKRHHRRVGAASLNPGSPLVKLATVAAGFLLADKINAPINKLNTIAPTATTPGSTRLDPTIVMAGEIGAGALLLFSKRRAGAMGMAKTVAGGLLVGAGLKRALSQFGVISGYQSVPVIGRRGVGGYQQVPVIGKMPSQLNGRPSQLSGGYGVNGGFPAAVNNGYIPHGSGPKVMGCVDPYAVAAGMTE
jgi:hypothetical protein